MKHQSLLYTVFVKICSHHHKQQSKRRHYSKHTVHYLYVCSQFEVICNIMRLCISVYLRLAQIKICNHSKYLPPLIVDYLQ